MPPSEPHCAIAGHAKAIYLELKADDVDEMRREIVAFGVRVLEMQDSHLYFQAPGGQVFRLVGTNEDLSTYEGTDHRELPGAFGPRGLPGPARSRLQVSAARTR